MPDLSFNPLVSFYIPWKQETSGFLFFTDCTERNKKFCIPTKWMIPKGVIQNRRHRKINIFDFPSHLATISHLFLTSPTYPPILITKPYFKNAFSAKNLLRFLKSCQLQVCMTFLWKRSANPLSVNPHKVVKHAQTICRQITDEFFEFVWPFCWVGTLRVKDRLPKKSILSASMEGLKNWSKMLFVLC